MNAVDTNVLLYFVDQAETTKQPKGAALLKSLQASVKPTVIPWQVVVELGAGLSRWRSSGRIMLLERDRYWQSISTLFPLCLPQSNLVPVAFALMTRHSLSYWDALLLGACIEAGVDTLYSEDLSDGVSYDSVKVINPFAGP